MAVDLHVHSTVSDGSLTPEECVRVAVEVGLSALAIADHDAVAGVAVAQAAAPEGLAVFPALEISAETDDAEIHILGYFIDCGNEPLNETLMLVRQSRVERAQVITEKLNALGVAIDYSEIERQAGGGSVGRPHVARALVERGTCSDQQEAFVRFLRKGRPAYVPRYRLSPQEGIELIRDAGGLPVMAHPGICRAEGVVEWLVDLGIGGLEAYHVAHSPRETEQFIETAHEYGLLVTGGSDSHGPGGSIPVRIGSVDVPDRVGLRLIEWAEKNNAFTTAQQV